MKKLLLGISALTLGGLLASGAVGQTPRGPEKPVPGRPPIMIDRQGSFTAGGTVMGDPATKSMSCDHGFVEYQIPVKPRAVNLWMWHSSSVQVWQNRWDGGEGYQSIFLRRGYPVYLWDGPRVGRGNWGCEQYTSNPGIGRDQQNFTSWRFGPQFPNFFPGSQFPVNDKEAWNQATAARYEEFDIMKNVMLEATAAAKAIDLIGPTVTLTNSAGGLRAIIAATKTDNIKGIVAYENVGYVFPEGSGPADKPGGFGPIHIPVADFQKLTRIPIQLIYGDHTDMGNYPGYIALAKQFVAAINAAGGHAEILMLPDAGLHGNTHIAFADMNNVAVADLLSAFLKKNHLDELAK